MTADYPAAWLRLQILRAAATLAAGALASGCMTFEAETITYRHDAAEDTLRAYVIYSGVYSDENLMDSYDKEQLRRTVTGEEVFFFDDWLISLDVNEFRKLSLTLLSRPEPQANDLEQLVHDTTLGLARRITANVRVSNGPFYFDEHGRLCAVQRVTFNHLSEILVTANRYARAVWLAEAKTSSSSDTWARAAADPRPGVAVDGQRVSYREPTSQDEYVEGSAFRTAFIAAGGRTNFADGSITWTFGSTIASQASITLPVKPGYKPNAVAFVREEFGVAEKFTPQADAARFFGERQ